MGALPVNLLAFIVAISVLVAVHEFGHYIVGRWSGMKVLRFSIGFGKPIFLRRAGADRTEYCISAIPLGGYVRFLDTREGPVAPEDEGRAFNQRPVPQRIAVLLAGPGFNFLFAFVAYWALAMNGTYAERPAIGEVTPESPAATAGLQQGDRIVAVDGEATDNWEQALIAMLETMVGDGRIPLLLEDDRGATRQAMIDVGREASRLTEPDQLFEGLGFRPGAPPVIIDDPQPDSAATAAGLERGDRIVAVEGTAVRHFGDLIEALRHRPGAAVTVEYVRDNRRYSAHTVLGERELEGERTGFLGVGLMRDAVGPVAAIAAGAERTWSQAIFTLRMLGRMLTGDVSIKNISGPINIAQFAGESAQRGLDFYVGFLALVSISLGILNLLPIPVLDGGQIVYQSIEGLKGSPLSERAQILGQQVGIFALILLMSFAFYNDIARFFD